MKKHTTKKRSRTNWARIDALKDREIDTSDIPELGKAFFKHAMLRLPDPKTAVTITSAMLPGYGRSRAPMRYGLGVQFEDRPGNSELGRLVESTVWINEVHPAYRRARWHHGPWAITFRSPSRSH